MRIEVSAEGALAWNGRRVRCALGRGGIRADKSEGDGATPTGCFPLRGVLYRPDRVAPPQTALPLRPIAIDDGWCDDPSDPRYNTPVKLPYQASHEHMWREDEIYDVVVILGHNDDPPVPGAGSAIFLHLARPDYSPTAGCVAVTRADLLALLKDCGPDSLLCVAG